MTVREAGFVAFFTAVVSGAMSAAFGIIVGMMLAWAIVAHTPDASVHHQRPALRDVLPD